MTRKLLIPFVTAGYPTRAVCAELLQACAAGGADQIELGIPFSDPLADGPVIQATSHQALRIGTTTDDAFALAEGVKGPPVLFMTYVNPVFQYGTQRFFDRAAKAGLKGVILPDVPPEEAGELVPVAEKSGVPLVFLVSPTCTDARIKEVGRLTKSWIYLVSLKGVTGAKMSTDLSSFAARVKKLTGKPICVGFGISTPEDAARVAGFADGVIVGSALLKIVEQGGGPAEVEKFVASLRKAID